MVDQPLHQAAGSVQRDLEVRVVVEDVEERAVAILVRRLEHAVEIADGLVVVQGEDESNRGSHAVAPGWRRASSAREAPERA